MKCMVIIFVQDVRTYVCRYGCMFGEKNYNIICHACGIIGVASHGKHTWATEHATKLGNKFVRL